MGPSRGLASLLVVASLGAASFAALSPATDDRVAARRAVEQVYWNHRLWPDDNPQAKPMFDQVVPDSAVRARVEETWRKAAALEVLSGRPVTPAMLQVELDRMARSTRAPLVLREIFDALGNDPARIVDAVVRPALTERLLREAYGDGFDAWWNDVRMTFAAAPSPLSSAEFVLPTIGGDACTPLAWEPTCCADGPPDGATGAQAVWTGSEMIVWGGASAAVNAPLGKRYDPATDTWTAMAVANEPSARIQHTAVWTGSEMIVWGGGAPDGSAALGTGGRYNPSTDTWASTSTAGSAPSPRGLHTAVWTGTRMIVWGGGEGSVDLRTGARYDPATDSWAATSVAGQAPDARHAHTAVWTGSRMIVWGGNSSSVGLLATGALYDPAADTWSATKPQGAPGARYAHTAVWTGTVMIVWGGLDSLGSGINSGGRYDPAQNKWTATSTGAGVPTGRFSHTAVWTGTRMLIWGGNDNGPAHQLGDGARYDPASDTWTSMSLAGAPAARRSHVGVWTGTRLVVWGGETGFSSVERLDSGGRYDPVADTWLPTRTNPSDPKRTSHTATWTGAELIVFGGIRSFTTSPAQVADPRRYDPATDTWSMTASTNVPSIRSGHIAVWTGSEVIVWGGTNGTDLGDGGRYDPAADTWTPIPAAGGPSPRSGHTAVWTGARMVIWGGGASTNTGALYDPGSGSWSTTSVGANVPSGRSGHSAVWTGHEMVVWGGGTANTGGRYIPAQDAWLPTSTAGAPSGRQYHTAVWTGSKMIIWGGLVGPGNTSTGGAYDPFNDAWTPTSLASGVPTGRSNHAAAWTGTEMVVWGGNSSGTMLGDGGRYDPATDSWTPIGAGATSPSPRRGHSASWIGTEVLVWGGDDGNEFFNTGAGLCLDSCASPGFWYPDVDGDGFGAIGVTVQACNAPAGYVMTSGDCDDRRPEIHPGAAEICNALDDNCDGTVDEGFPVAGSPGLLVNHAGDSALLSWSPAGGVAFDVEDGVIEYLKSFGTFTYSCQLGVVSNYAGTSVTDPRVNGVGQTLYYLVRGHSCSGAIGSWSSGAPSELAGRDSELSVPHGTCP
ncbi:MAG TPA: kelch repeat-containing protein [Candidatus Polarisedimenticolaceae bacterium]|nr:kelch repeat-containing protein [Candidatus Polarisedimenticolaceae bacterium]